jgi:hypothetical protein
MTPEERAKFVKLFSDRGAWAETGSVVASTTW